MSGRSGAEVIFDYLVERKVPYFVGLCGHADVGLLDVALSRQADIKTVSVHHEQTAGYIADAYYRVAGVPLATFTSVGPGSINIQTAVANALMDSSAMLAITGNVPTMQFNKGPFQEIGYHYQADFTTAMRPYVKRSFQAPRPEMLPDMLRHAFNVMLSGRTGPVHLDVPLNVFAERTEARASFSDEWRDDGSVYSAGGDARGVEAAVDLLLSARQPVILAGHGCLLDRTAAALVLELGELTGMPVATTPQGKGAIDEYHPLCLGPSGRDGTYPANRATRAADVLLALGTRFGDRSTSSWRDKVTHSLTTKLIHVDIEPSQLGRNYPPAVGIVGSTGTVLRQIIDSIKRRGPAAIQAAKTGRAAWDQRFPKWKKLWDEAHSGAPTMADLPIHPDRVMAELNAAMPKDAVVLSDIGMHHTWMVQQWKVPKGGRLLQSGGLAGMGFGVCGAIGAQLAAPGKPVVAVVGDGGFIMHANAVLTAVEYGLPIVWVIWNNLGYVSIRDLQRGFFGPDREHASRFRKTSDGELFSADYALMAQSMGADGVRVDKPGDVGNALRAALAAGRPTVIDVRVASEVKRRTAGVLDFPPLLGADPNFDPDPM